MSYIRRIAVSFSATGMILGMGFFCVSLTPSLLPRAVVVQGILSGVVFAAGYGIGTAGHWTWTFMELRDITGRWARGLTWGPMAVMALTAILTLNRMTTWQNSIRTRMEMLPIDSAYPVTVLCVATVTALVIVLLTRLLLAGATRGVDTINRYLPRRIAIVLGGSAFVLLFISFVDGVIVKSAMHTMDDSFATLNWILDSDDTPPQGEWASGSKRSLISWADIGRNGKRFIADGPTRKEISAILGREAMQPIRVYAGFNTGNSLKERAQIALAEMIRVGGFDRTTLVVATSTGTGWLDPSAMDSVEFIHAGDIATVSLQYSYLPSWLTLMVEPELSRKAANALFRAIFNHWTRLPHDKRPELYLHGLSLGALGSEFSADLTTIITDPINGALWSGPPFLSRLWGLVTRARTPDSPQWRPVYHDSTAIRFMTQDGFPNLTGAPWGPLRIVYLQHASDPMSFFSTDLAYVRPDWLGPNRGRDISPYFNWFPVVTFFQTAFDIPMATTVPLGYGHNFAPAAYIDAWIEVTQPKNWGPSDTLKLKAHFKGFNPRPI